MEGATLRKAVKRPVMNLELFQIADAPQMKALFKLLAHEPEVIHYYLKEIVFPRTMRIQRVKISASGQELGSEMLFGRRLGFSGTPSNLLPTKIAPCHFERGSEGKILRTLCTLYTAVYTVFIHRGSSINEMIYLLTTVLSSSLFSLLSSLFSRLR